MIHSRIEATAVQHLPARKARPGWVAVLLAVLLAFSWQSFVTQTHEHFDRVISSAAGSAETTAVHWKGGHSPANSGDTCPICREIAQAGHYLMPTFVEFQTPSIGTYWLSFQPSHVSAPTLRSHAWHSRAPPSQLQP